MQRLVERCAGLDVHKDTVAACIRVPGDVDRREEIRTFKTTTRGLLTLRDWLASQAITVVAMESTGVYWKPVWYLLEDDFDCQLINAQHVKNLPGRKTDVQDAAWLCQLVEHGLVRASFVPPPQIRDLRDLTRYRKVLIQERTREVQRLHRVLEDAGVKLSSVASRVLGVSGRSMIEALITGTTDPDVLAELARGVLRNKMTELREALEGRFRAHHALIAGQMLGHIDYLDEAINTLSDQIERLIAPFADKVDLLDTIPGIDKRTAEVLIAEIGPDMSRFPSSAHLASWAGMCPGNNQSGGKRMSGRTRKGSKWLREALVESARSASRTKNTYLAAHYQRIKRNRGSNKAAVAVGHTILVAAFHILRDDIPFADLGPDYFEQRRNKDAHVRRLVRQLENLGMRVTLENLPESA